MKISSANRVAQPSLAAGFPGIPARSSSTPVGQGCPAHPQAGKPALPKQRGVALVVTLILLSVITFLAVAFLFLSRRERGAVKTSIEQANARRAAEGGTERAIAETVAGIIASQNQFNYDLRVSTNFANTLGFNPAPAAPEFVTSLTNVNYDHLVNGAPLTQTEFLQNLANLFYSPRPPVFVDTNRPGTPGPKPPADFRYYLDLNRNGRFETNGWWPVLTGDPANPFFDTNGVPITAAAAVSNPTNILRQFFVGDPEWVGVLQRPDRPHSPTNLFGSRFAYVIVPTGKTLDANTIHNQAKHSVAPLGKGSDGFSRNTGVGTYELNLASFLVDLNTNAWEKNFGGTFDPLPVALVNPVPYYYDTTPYPGLQSSTGTAFEDALALVRYRYGGNWNNLRSITTLYGNAGANAFRFDGIDGYGSGPLMLTSMATNIDGDNPSRVNYGWPGAENPNHFFTSQDVFDPNKTTGVLQVSPNTFSDRLFNVGYFGLGSYNRYTYYRMLAQLGTDSAPEIPDKMDLNYVNVNAAGQTVVNAQTNFVDWQPLQFFTNAVDRILRATFDSATVNVNDFGVRDVLSYTNIPVMVSNRFVYTPALHRCLQVAANLHDSTVTRVDGTLTNYPSVFRPSFRRQKNPFNASIEDVYIAGFTEVGAVGGFNDAAYFAIPLDLNDLADRTAAGTAANQNIYGVPWVIGARKGFPNFNEFALQSVSQMSRKLQIRKLTPGATTFVKTNQMFIVGVSNMFAFELWNSYSANYSRDSQVLVANDITMSLSYTNDPQFDLKGGTGAFRTNLAASLVVPGATTPWYGYGADIGSPAKAAFKVPLNTNLTFLPDSIFRTASGNTVFTTNINVGLNLVRGFEDTGKFHVPLFNFSSSNRIRCILLDTATMRVLDYVQLNDLNGVRNLSSELTDSTTGASFVDGTGSGQSETIFWQTNRIATNGASIFMPTMGVRNQIDASLGNINVPDWSSIGAGVAAGRTKDKEIDGFRQFMGLASLASFSGQREPNTNIILQVPFTPTRKTSQYLTWQANDPLVHYTAGDLTTVAQGTGIRREQPNGVIKPIPNIGQLNGRFEPWGGNPSSSSETAASSIIPYNLAAKDPGIYAPDDWDFSTNKFPTIGFLGRVHRGTPWQTIYMKSEPVNLAEWSKWTGNTNYLDAQLALPLADRVLFDVFTTAIDQNATRGQLNVNQTGLAAWSAALGGVVGLTNVSTDAELDAYQGAARLDPYVIAPAGASGGDNSVLGRIHKGITDTRNSATFKGYFKHSGDVLAVPQLTVASPLLNTNSTTQLRKGISDAAYERIPQMIMGLLRGNDQPRFTIYTYGQSLAPARGSRYMQPGPYFNLCTNYQITAEFATRTVVRIEGAPGRPRAVIESFNVLGPE